VPGSLTTAEIFAKAAFQDVRRHRVPPPNYPCVITKVRVSEWCWPRCPRPVCVKQCQRGSGVLTVRGAGRLAITVPDRSADLLRRRAYHRLFSGLVALSGGSNRPLASRSADFVVGRYEISAPPRRSAQPVGTVIQLSLGRYRWSMAVMCERGNGPRCATGIAFARAGPHHAQCQAEANRRAGKRACPGTAEFQPR